MFRTCILLIGLFFAWEATTLPAQSCCSGGVPLSNNLGMPEAEVGVLQLNLAYDYNRLNTLKSGWNRLDDNSRERLTRSYFLDWSISFGERLSLEGILPYIQQERNITQITGTDFSNTSGLGDMISLLHYTLLRSKMGNESLRIAGGVKAPLGRFDLTNDLGIVYNAELQPGSGAWDIIFWAQYLGTFGFRPSLGYHFTLAYSQKGKNRGYLGDQIYQFGNEMQISAGIADRFLLGKKIIDSSIGLRYRTVGEDQFNNAALPATGGQWLFFEPGISYWLGLDMSLNVTASLPVFSFVQDTQFSPTIRYTFGWFYRMKLWNK